jgi:fermentation-respiration switch protein FrsA (DUF1100 family)
LFKGIAIVCVALYLLALAGMAIGQRRFLYFPSGRVQSPAGAGLAGGRDETIRTADGERLHAWYVPPRDGKPLLLYFHGNGGSIAGRVDRFRVLTSTGNGLLAIDYRGYPGSTGSSTEAGLHRDADAAYAFARDQGIPPARLVIVGESLGTGVAVALAARSPCAAIVLDSPYSSIADVAAAQFWMFPVRLMLRDQFRSDRLVGQIKAPMLMVHGTVDPVIPLPFAEKLYTLAQEPKQFIRVEGAGHLAMGDVLPQVLDWIKRTVG